MSEQAMLRAAEFLENMANRLDAWADSSLGGGWSTHQVDVNRFSANDCRREAAKLRQAIGARPSGA